MEFRSDEWFKDRSRPFLGRFGRIFRPTVIFRAKGPESSYFFFQCCATAVQLSREEDDIEAQTKVADPKGPSVTQAELAPVEVATPKVTEVEIAPPPVTQAEVTPPQVQSAPAPLAPTMVAPPPVSQ